MAIISVKSNGNRVWKGNKFMFLLLCIILQTSSTFISVYGSIWRKTCKLWIYLFPSFNQDRYVLLWELNTECHVPTQGMENLEFTSWPAHDEWPKENTWLERKEPHFIPNFTLRRPPKTTDLKVPLPPPWSPPTLWKSVYSRTELEAAINWIEIANSLNRLHVHHHINRI